MSPIDTYDLYFTGKDDPRGCIVIGEDTKPVYLVFETSHIPSTRTTVYRNQEEVVALFDWIPGNHFGRAVIGTKQLPMSNLVLPGSAPNARLFWSEGTRFEWRRCYEDPNSYDLFAIPNKRIAIFRRYAQSTPIGPSHGMLQYTFSHDRLLLEALLALCLNRWIDWRGM
jgi:hypothetical protein